MLSVAEIVRLTEMLVELLLPLFMLTEVLLGAEVSLTTKLMLSESESETFPDVSLNQTYTVRGKVPRVEELETVKSTVSEYVCV